MKTLKKLLLKKNYYYEFKKLYDTLPDKVEIIENCKQIEYDRVVTEGEILKEYAGKLPTFEQAYGYALGMIDSLKIESKWNLVFFEHNGVACRLRFGLFSDGELYANVLRVSEADEWDSPRVGFPLCNKNLDTEIQTLEPSDALRLKNFITELKILIKNYEAK